MYTIYLECRDRAYIIEMDEGTSSRRQGILSVNTNDRDEILRIGRCPTLISQSGYQYDLNTCVKDISMKERANVDSSDGADRHIDIDIILGDSDSAIYQPEITSPLLHIDEIADGYLLRDADGNEQENIVFHVTLIYKNLRGYIDIFCASSETIYDVVIDFGSEASQMLVKRHRDAWGAGAIVQLFNGCLRHFYPSASAQSDYDQKDRDPRLMRSLFFKKPNATSPVTAAQKQEFLCYPPSADDGYLQFISRRDDENKGERLPNIKISYLAQINRSGFDLEMLHHALVLRFLHEAVRQVADKERVRCNTKKGVAIRVTLLVPNVMGQEAVSKLIEEVADTANSTEFLKHLPHDCPPLLFTDVKSCSESDASFLYWMNTTAIKAGKDYLVIDVGKGTTDFSVVHVKDASNAISKYRSGFLGAGNAISYAIFEYMLLQLTDAIETSDRIQEIRRILHSDTKTLYQLEDIIEHIKQGMTLSGTTADELRRIAHAEHWSEENLSDLLQHFKLEDEERIIAGIIQKIVAGIALRTQGLHYDEIMLSGRGFLYAPLAHEVKTIFGKHQDHHSTTGTGYSDIYYRPEYAKTGCLYGAIAPVKISMQSNMTGIPQFVDARKSAEMNEEEVNQMIDKQVNENKALNATPEENEERRKGLLSMAKQCWKYFFSDEDEDEDDEKKSEDTDSQVIPEKQEVSGKSDHQELVLMGDDNIRAIMQSRYPVKLFGANTRVYIGGNQYKIVGDDHLPDGDGCKLYFDGAHFFIRSKDHSYELVEDVARIPNTNLLFESLFPFSLQILGENYDIPRNRAVTETI